MGVGDSLEAATTLAAPIAAGTWTLVGDGIVFAPIDVRFEVLRRRAAAPALAVFHVDHHFDPPATGGFAAVTFDATAAGAAVDYAPGDSLVWRFTPSGTDAQATYIPNGDGANAHGRIPSLALPR